MTVDYQRILTFDGGGLYGLTSCYWLRDLVARDPLFLADVQLFAGTSAGGLNALLLADCEDPREGVERLITFWNEPDIFSNTDPIQRYYSLFGITPWYGTSDLLRQLQRWFGDRRMSELKHPVLVTAYNWHGGAVQFPQGDPFTLQAAVEGLWRDEAAHLRGDGGRPRHWEPVVFTNWMTDAQDHRIVDVAFAAAAMPGMRAVRGGAGDGGTYSANPSVQAIAAILRENHGELRFGEAFHEITHSTLARLSMLSLGAGDQRPAYWLRNFNLGAMPWAMFPVDPWSVLWPPATFLLQPAAEVMDTMARELLGENYHRMNPGILEIPTATTVYACRTGWIRQLLIQYIENASRGPRSREAVAVTAAFLGSERWRSQP